jgi:hypothetical protein
MADKWNNNKIYTPLKGRALDIVPKALENGGAFLTMAQAMDRRAAVATSNDQNLINTWFGNGFWVMTPVIYDTNGNVIIGDITNKNVMNYISQITPALSGNLYRGRMALPEEFRITDVSGAIFNKNQIAKYGNKLKTEKEAKRDPLWMALAGNSQERHDSYVEQVYKLAKDNKYNKTELMGVWLDNLNEKNSLGLFWFGSLGDYDSLADGCYALNNFGRVLRVQAPEAQVETMYSNLKKHVSETSQPPFKADFMSNLKQYT